MKFGYGQIIIAALLFLALVLNPVQLSTGAELSNSEQGVRLELLYSSGTLNSLARNILFARTEQILLPPQRAVAAELPLPELPELVYNGTVVDKVAITFDDGPYPGKTEQYLEILSQYGIEGTFFVVGEQAQRNPAQLQMIVEQGSELGSHSWAHGRLDKMPLELVLSDLKRVAELVYDITGQEIKYIRPPYGRYSRAVIEAAGELKQQLVLWNVDPRDWDKPTAEQIVSRVMEQVRPGSIIILHEGHQNTIEALPLIIERLQGQGLQPVPVSELLRSY
ncbi:MAG TPA: polysaccharide deacetylase family protein [Firmicutes bacterium]|jgi:peptidoglycan/xylan/chitin deacetylase (PgdA/CDA1 family)|nr:polysaccharide deacetylase family protein [Bacillota bacterium]